MPQEEKLDRREIDAHWHLDKRFNVGHMLTTLTVVGSFLVYGNSIQDRVEANHAELAHQKEIIQRVEHNSEVRDHQTRTQLEKIDSKIDRLLDRELRKASGK